MNLMDTILSNLEDLCKPIIVCDDSGSSAINFKDFSFSPDDIILTDGYAPFPQEKLAGGIPVLWLLNNEEVNPPWGKDARITV